MLQYETDVLVKFESSAYPFGSAQTVSDGTPQWRYTNVHIGLTGPPGVKRP